jgi:propanol-preferring alcohol dehydrogenase
MTTQYAQSPGGTTMAAYQLLGWGQGVERVEVPVPRPRGREVLVEVQAVGLCHSDLFVMDCDEGVLPYDLPLTLGHEVAGRVVAVGEDADGTLVGASGVVHGVWSCGECHNCLRGLDNYCVALEGRVGCGLGRDGGLAHHVLLPDGRHFVPASGVPPTSLAPLADAGLTAYHAISQHRDALVGDCAALVIGVGGLGHLAVQILRATSSARVVAVDPRAEACALAESLGAHHTATSVEEGMAHLAASSGLRGVDVVLDFVGSDGTMRVGADVLTPGGRLVVVGGARGSIAVGKGMTLPLGWQVSAPFWGRRDDLVAVVELAERGLLDPVIEVVPFDAVPEAYARLRDGAVAGRLVAVHDNAPIPLAEHRKEDES